MQKIKFLFVIALAGFFIACEQENNINEPTENFTFEQPKQDGIYLFDSNDPMMPFTEYSIDGNLGNNIPTANRNPNVHLTGNFTGFTPTSPEDNRFYKSASITFNALENSQGTSGIAVFERTWGDNGEFSWKFKAHAEQVFTQGNDAVYCGNIFQESGPRPFNINGSKVWFRVVDNGTNGDEYYDVIFFNPSGIAPCSFFAQNGPAAILWNLIGKRVLENEDDFITLN